MLGRLTQGKVAPVLESSGALKREKCGFLAVIFFILTLFRCVDFIGALVQFLKTASGYFSFGAEIYDAMVQNHCKVQVHYDNKTHREGLYQLHGVPMC